jgi:hypothetical protein
MRPHPFRRALLTLLVSSALASAAEPRWFKGNLHTHSLWSDGDDYPEMIADWFKREGYHFLAISDHNILQQGQRWLELKTPVAIGGVPNDRGGGMVLEKYLRRFGPDWVETREAGGKRSVRLKPLDEYRSLLEEPGRFLMIPSQEITSSWKKPKTETLPERTGPVHINITNPREHTPPIAHEDATAIIQRTIDAARAQRERTGQAMFVHVNHPNFRSGLTAEDMMPVKGEQFFEVYNGHPGVDNEGDAARLSMDAMWDAILTVRLGELGLEPMFGVGTDDSHHYHTIGLGKSNAGRGWVMVRARHLTAESIVKAMEAGDFYASSGVTLDDVKREGRTLSVAIKAEPGVTYRTQFIGTRRGYDKTTELLPPLAKGPARTMPHRRYSKDVGAVLAEVAGASPGYTLRGDELYVRAKIISSKAKALGSVAGEFETAWTQPLVNEAK